MNRIYLDNAATSWPKPETVYRVIDSTMRNLGAPLGRGNYRQAQEVGYLIEQTRDALARLIGAPDRKQVAFTYSCTDALNLAIQGLQLEEGHVVTSVTEHNSVLRQLRDLEERDLVKVSRILCDAEGIIDTQTVIDAIEPDTRLVALNHVSNVTGTIQALEPVGRHCQELGIPFLVDAAQSMGHIQVDVSRLGCDLLTASGHKGLLAPLGTGFLYFSAKIGERLRPLRLGGTGSSAGNDRQPQNYPEKFEAGNMNVPGIVGLGAGISFLESEEGLLRKDHYRQLNQNLFSGLSSLANLRLFGPSEVDRKIGIFSFAIEGYTAHELAAVLDSAYFIQTRAGFHCAPLMHACLGSAENDGLLRISTGLFSNQLEIDTLLFALSEISKRAE